MLSREDSGLPSYYHCCKGNVEIVLFLASHRVLGVKGQETSHSSTCDVPPHGHLDLSIYSTRKR